MKTINVSEATGPTLDWLVWVAAGGAAAYPKTASGPAFLKLWKGNTAKYVHPSTDWSQGGPILERELLAPEPMLDANCSLIQWRCQNWKGDGADYYGSTPLISAMRAYVTSKLGNTVEVPEELT